MRSAGSHLNADTWRDCIIFLTSSLLGMEGGGELFIRSLIAHLRTIDNRRWEGRKTSEAYSMTFQISPNSVCTGEWRDNACCACYLIREFSYTYAGAVFVKKSGNMLERRTIRGRITYDSLRG